VRRAGVLIAALLALAAVAPAADASFGFPLGSAGFSVAATQANGDPADLAGSHPYALTTKIAFNQQSPSGFPQGDVKDLFVELPPGLIENPGAVPKCTESEFSAPRSSPFEASRSGESCPEASQIGVVGIDTAAGTRHFGVFNLVPPPGYPSRFGFSPYGTPVSFLPRVRQADGEYGLTLVSRNFSQLFDTRAIELTIWGNPWATSHDGERGNCLNEAEPASPHAQCEVPLADRAHGLWAYLTLPSSCSGPLTFSIAADSWQQPGGYLPSGLPDLADPAWNTAEHRSAAGLKDCDQLDFFSLAKALPSASSVSSSTGLSFSLEPNLTGLLAADKSLSSRIKRATIALPEGITINPSVGAGLGACTEAQYAAETPSSAPGAGCPNPSKIGLVTVRTPLVEDALKGSLFIAKPFANPFGSAYALYFVAKSAERGFMVKVAGKLDADPLSGRLTATFDNLPQLPYTDLKVDFREGQRAPLVTPAACGRYTTQIALNPWIDPGATLQQTSSFEIVRGITAGGACPTGGAPFTPRATAGTLNANAGSATAFYLHLTRNDYEQEITSYSAQLPPGLLGRIAGISFCPDAAIEAAKGRAGAAELERPSCPAASEIGHTFSGYGAGLAPAYAPGKFYLAGPYHGAPLSVVAINSAIVGPFDLGTIVIRSAIQVDPRSARVTIDSSASDPIPHIFAGIPLRLRDVRVHVDRPAFMVNPTSCAPFSIASTLTGSDAPFANPRDVVATATVPYQLSNCSSLKFSPAFALSLRGPTKRGGYPQLRAVVTPRPGGANIASAAVTLPPSLFLAQEHIGEICTRTRFRADACPAGSIVGKAKAETPLLSEPMEGAVFLRSSDNSLPDLVAVLHGRGVRIDLEGRIDSHRGGIRGRFEGLPDAPLTRFTMTIFGGRKRGILVNSENLCRSPQIADARFLGHSNAGVVLKPKVNPKCRKGVRKHRRGKSQATGRGR
jgi:hypothetical protein